MKKDNNAKKSTLRGSKGTFRKLMRFIAKYRILLFRG